MQKKKIHIELMRILAIYFVMFNHTQSGGFFYFAENRDDPLYYFYMFISILCKIAVPLFFMITGALLLKKNESLKEVYFKRILKYIIILFFISFFYYLWLYQEHSIMDFIKTIYSKDVTSGLWYLYSYIGILIMLPVLRKVVENLTEKEYLYIWVCQIIFVGIIPILEYLFWQGEVTLNNNLSVVIFTTDNVIYVLLGYYCENILDINKITKKKIIFLSLTSAFAIIISCAMTNYRAMIMGLCNQAVSQTFFSSLICIPAVTIYIFFRKICMNGIQKTIEKIIIKVGASVFGAYLFEKLIRSLTAFIYGGLYQRITPFWASIVWVIVGMTIGLSIVTMLRNIPFVKKYIRKVI